MKCVILLVPKMICQTMIQFMDRRQEGQEMATGRISAKQQEILDFIKSEIINKGYPPAVREICEAVHL